MALYMGLAEPQHEEVVLKNLIDDIRGRGNAVTAGDIGYRYVVQTLQDRGASDVLFDMNSRYDVPGYGYQIAMGETALAESWQSRDYLSHNHCMLGHLYSWLFSGIGGISQESGSTAYKRIVIERQARIGPQGYYSKERCGRTYRAACRLGRLPDRRREIAGPGVRARSGGESA